MVRGTVPALREAAAPGDDIVELHPHAGSGSALRTIGRASGALARLAYEQLALPRHARDVDTVHLFDARAPLMIDKPVVLTVHDVSYLDCPQWFSRGAARYKALMLAASLRRRPAAVVCDSELTRERLLAHHHEIAGPIRVEVVRPGVAPPPPRPEVAEPERPFFLTVATIEPRKNHLGLLRAFRQARADGLDLDWKVVGADGHCAPTIRPALEETDGVHVLGAVDDAELERLYATATFLAAPSLLEGFGYPPLEAMARGVPVIASAGGVFDETLGDAALRVDPLDSGGWAAALRGLSDDERHRADLVRRGREQARRFPWARTAEALMAIHRDAVEPD